MFDNHVVQVIVTAIGPDVFVGIRAVGCFGARHRRLFRVYDRTVRVLNGFIGVGIDTEQYVFVAGIIAIFYSVDYRAVAGGEGDKASLLACIYLVPFFIGIYIIYRVVDTFIGVYPLGMMKYPMVYPAGNLVETLPFSS